MISTPLARKRQFLKYLRFAKIPYTNDHHFVHLFGLLVIFDKENLFVIAQRYSFWATIQYSSDRHMVKKIKKLSELSLAMAA